MMSSNRNTEGNIDFLFRTLKRLYPQGAFPGRDTGGWEIKKEMRTPFRVLISTILSQRTRDENTHIASEQLFSIYPTSRALAEGDLSKIMTLIRPVGFYRQKARTIKEVAQILIEKYDGNVPDNIEELLALPGVGRKTANCVLSYGFGKPAIAVDTHVHRISNRLGLVSTKRPVDTELQLMKILPKKYWSEINELLVRFGQDVCRPIGPKCGPCPLHKMCKFSQ